MEPTTRKLLQPVGDRILVKRLEADEKTEDGLIIPENAKDKPHRGIVLACGPGSRDSMGQVHPMPVTFGDLILFSKWTPVEFKDEGVEYLIVREDDVLGIFPENQTKGA